MAEMTMPENDYEMFSRRPDQLIPGWNVDPIDIGAGLKMLYEIGWGWDPDSPTVMTITYALQRWARGGRARPAQPARHSLLFALVSRGSALFHADIGSSLSLTARNAHSPVPGPPSATPSRSASRSPSATPTDDWSPDVVQPGRGVSERPAEWPAVGGAA